MSADDDLANEQAFIELKKVFRKYAPEKITEVFQRIRQENSFAPDMASFFRKLAEKEEESINERGESIFAEFRGNWTESDGNEVPVFVIKAKLVEAMYYAMNPKQQREFSSVCHHCKTKSSSCLDIGGQSTCYSCRRDGKGYYSSGDQ